MGRPTPDPRRCWNCGGRGRHRKGGTSRPRHGHFHTLKGKPICHLCWTTAQGIAKRLRALTGDGEGIGRFDTRSAFDTDVTHHDQKFGRWTLPGKFFDEQDD